MSCTTVLPVAPTVVAATCGADEVVVPPTVTPATTPGITYTVDPPGPYGVPRGRAGPWTVAADDRDGRRRAADHRVDALGRSAAAATLVLLAGTFLVIVARRRIA